MDFLTRPLPHFLSPQSSLGQVFKGASDMDWNFSNSWPHFEQTYSYVGTVSYLQAVNSIVKRSSRLESGWSEKSADNRAKKAQWSRVLEALGRLVELLQREFGVPVKFLVVDDLANGSLAAVDFGEDLIEVAH